MNEYDSDRMADLMDSAYGLKLVSAPEQADVVLLNTCSIREKAEEKVFSDLGRYRKLKDRRPGMIIGVGGCVGQQEGERIQQRAPYVDIVFGPQTYHQLPELVKQVRRDRVKIAITEMPDIEKFDHLPERKVDGVSSHVTIMEGCDKFCTFCIVPYTRGEELSRPVQDVLAECQNLLDQGVVEITLLGQNVNGFRGAGLDGVEWDFAMLLYAVAELPGLKRLRFTTSHPMEMSSELIQAFADIPSLMPFLHLPVQSGSDHVLESMHRGHTAKHYMNTVAELRGLCPDIALSSDFIVGFPGESDEDFLQTLALVEDVKYAFAFAFKYSSRPGTPAAKMSDNVPEDVKDRRLQALLTMLRDQVRQAHKDQLGKEFEVLIEGKSKEKGDLKGRTPDFKIVHFAGDSSLIGQFARVRMVDAYGQSLRGELVS